MKTLFVFCALCSNMAMAQVAADVKPDPAYTHHLSSSGPLSKEQLLKQKPDDYDAYLAVGVENYLAGIKPAPVRWLLQMGGVQTDKQQGIVELRMAAQHGDLLAPFAKLLLAVAALRDKDTGTACGLLTELSGRYPKNPLYTRELYRCR